MQLFKSVDVPDRKCVVERLLRCAKSPKVIVVVMLIWVTVGFGLTSYFIKRSNLQGSLITLVVVFPVFGVVYTCIRIKEISQCAIQVYRANKKVEIEKPPSYDDVISAEAPPPAYYELFSEVEGQDPSAATETSSRSPPFASMSSSPSTPSSSSSSSCGELTHRQRRTSQEAATSHTRKASSFNVIYVPAIVIRMKRKFSLNSICGTKWS